MLGMYIIDLFLYDPVVTVQEGEEEEVEEEDTPI